MAKFEVNLAGNMGHFKEYLKKEILNGSISASFEDEYEEEINGVRCCTMVFERYSYLGGNRVSLSVTILGYEEEIRMSAITSGGSQAVFFKINTFGEEAFLDKLAEAVRIYQCRHAQATGE